ncbi:MAG: stage V sporulation protein AD, partial [Clostridia bacterium]
KQKTFQGGSGTGCINTVFNGYILKKLQRGELKRILVVPTGALLSRDTPLQKETIPGIAHAFVVEVEEN